MDHLGDRMKRHEGAWAQVLPERTPVVVRVDGKAFHTATRGLQKPVDERIRGAMRGTAVYLLANMQNAVMAYQQSDEISILMINYQGQFTQSWYGNKVQKIVSVAASLATKAFNDNIYGEGLQSRDWLFDARAFSLPREEVRNYFVWRQMDATRNSISNLGRCHFSQKELNGKPSKEVLEMLKKVGVHWELMPIQDRMGSVVIRDSSNEDTYRLIGETPNFVSSKSFFEPFINPPVEVELGQEVAGS